MPSTPIWLDDVICSSTDQTLLQCMHNSVGDVSCDHSDDVALRCSTDFVSSSRYFIH